MKQNVGGLDSVIRVMLGLGLVLAAAGTLQWTLLSVALVLLSIPLFRTALSGSCPVYSLFGIDTTGADAKHHTGPHAHRKT
ncbi:MAG TPA: DUF2892 domain-containing protein [Gemmatimonadales bacterium]|jgi:ABC-type uncharacterized transport system permease subunit|nr:DUF2892 domain-containing protein [Gemmatimonadales bacterium]